MISRGGEDSRDPVVPVSGVKQREALDFLVDNILSDEAFEFSPQLLRRLTREHWYHWGSGLSFGSSDVNVYDRVLRIQQIVLRHCLNAGVLNRLQNQQLMIDAPTAGDEGNEPLRISELFRTLTDSIWSEIAVAGDANGDANDNANDNKKSNELECSIIRRNLQRDHLSRLNKLVLGNSRNPYGDLFGFALFFGGSSNYPADARSLARAHLIEINERITTALEKKGREIDESTRAHLSESSNLIEKVLNARIESNRH